MDITKMSLEELKALAYDVSVRLTNEQRNLQMVEQQIRTKASEPKKEKNGKNTNE